MSDLKTYEELTFTHDDLVILTSYMAEHNYPASEVAYAVEKPWKFVETLNEAKAELARETAGVVGE